MRSIAALLVLALVAPAAVPAQSVDGRHAPFDALLAANVRDERVDYLAIRDGHFDALRAYLDGLAALKPADIATQSRDDQLALLVNLYNATTVAAVCERYVEGWTPAAAKFVLFDDKIVRLGGATFSLNELEHERIRKVFGDPRVHVALVCAARSCPPLLPRAYRGSDLDAVLEAKTRAFVADAARNRIGKGGAGNKVELSKIFEWYRADFGKDEAAMLGWLSRYADAALAGSKVSYLEYSWAPNLSAPQPPDEWVVAAVATQKGDLSLRAGEVVRVVDRARAGWTVAVRAPFGKGEIELPASQVKPFRPPGNQ